LPDKLPKDHQILTRVASGNAKYQMKNEK